MATMIYLWSSRREGLKALTAAGVEEVEEVGDGVSREKSSLSTFEKCIPWNSDQIEYGLKKEKNCFAFCFLIPYSSSSFSFGASLKNQTGKYFSR